MKKYLILLLVLSGCAIEYKPYPEHYYDCSRETIQNGTGCEQIIYLPQEWTNIQKPKVRLNWRTGVIEEINDE